MATRPGADPDLRRMFAQIPKVDAVRRPPRGSALRPAGWDRRRRLAFAAAAVGLFFLYGGPAAATGAAASDLLVTGGAVALGASIVASYVPARGARADLSPCALLPLLWAVGFMPWVFGTGGMNALVAVGLMAVFAVQRATGVGCRV